MKKLLLSTMLAALTCTAAAQSQFDDVEIVTTHIGGSVHMLVGSGGNIGVSAGDDGVLMIDDQYAPLAEKITAAIAELTDAPKRFVINTHYHGDHTGSNAYFAQNKGMTIFAHENVRIRLAAGEDVDQAMLPVVTYQDGIKFHLNNETIHVFHLEDGHTDGDSAVWFEQPDILHTGDLFFKDMFPYIDLGAGGSVTGYIQSVETLLSKIDDDTKVIPGHGSLANKADLQRFLDMLKETHAHVQSRKAGGLTEQDLIDTGLPEKWDSWAWRFINEERWIKTLYQ